MRFNDFFKNIYVINVDSDVKKWNDCQEELKRNDIINYNRFSGVIINNGKTIENRSLGCVKSHLELIKMCYEKNMDYLVVFEDDIEFHPEWNSRYNQIIDFVKNNDFDIFYPGGNPVGINRQFKGNVYSSEGVLTTHSYIINGKRSKELYNIMSKIPDSKFHRTYCIDTAFVEHIHPTRKKTYIYRSPRLTAQRSCISYIRGKPRNYGSLRDWKI